ncbi:glycosyltransferase [Labrys sp. KNU-23]|uniref:glycosyltransferase n=1 Tax=Labrys sp. KNU-23 TaxID=2789216 RepID=UPI0011EF985C|nr:glycosyltransferase [Labrys sp. KNU-23]QEN89300.1 glycosyltransferase [Labrys sp. KNU-23]
MTTLAGLVGFLASLWWAGLIALLLGSTLLALLQPTLAARRAVAGERGPISVLVPLRRIEETQSEASRKLLDLDYPGLEILFSVSRKQTEGAASHPFPPGEGMKRAGASLLFTTPIPDANPKIANLVESVEAAVHDLLLIKDAGTILPSGVLAAMTASLVPGVGLVCAVPVARAPGNFAALLEASLVNTYGGRLLLALSALGGGAGIGAAMLLRRRDLQAAGGLSAILNAVADDHALAKLLRGRGLRPVFAGATVDQDLGARRPGQIWQRHLRWAICRRLEEPLAFAAEPLTGLPAACLAAFAGAAFLGLPAMSLLVLTILLWPAAECVLAWRKGWPLIWAMPFAVLLREVIMPALWLNALLARRLAWGTATIALAGRR